MKGNVSKAKAFRKIARDLESLEPMYEQPRGRNPALMIAKARMILLKDDASRKRNR